MRVFIISLFFFCSLFSFSQGRKSVDNENGVLHFKLNSKINLYEKKLEYDWIDEKGTEFYKYVGNDVKELFGYEVKSIHLIFVNDELFNINVNFGSLSEEKNWELLDILRHKYDVPEIIYPNNHINFIAVWETGKVIMQMEEYSCWSPVFKCETNIFWTSKALKKKLESNK